MADRVVIVGGGVAGLVTAYELRHQGVPSLVLEADDRVGGRVHTLAFDDGATAECCMEEFWESSPAYGLLKELDLPSITHPAHSSVIVDGELIAFRASDEGADYFDRLRLGEGHRSFDDWNLLGREILGELVAAQDSGRWSRRLSVLRKQSFESFVAGLGLSKRAAQWIRLLVESEIATDWSDIAAIDGVAEMGPFLLTESGRAETNVRVAGGNERLVTALLTARGDQPVLLGAKVRRVVDNGRGVLVQYVDRNGRTCVERGSHAVITPPLWTLDTMDLEPRLDPISRAAVATTAAGSYVKVVLRVRPDRVRISERDGEPPFTLLTPGPIGCVYLTDGRPTGRDHVVTMLIHGGYARALRGVVPRDILARAVMELDRLTARWAGEREPTPVIAGVADAVTDAMVFNHPQAVAYWPNALGRSRFDATADVLRAPHGRVLIGGDSTDRSHSDGAVRAGQRMAALILDRRPTDFRASDRASLTTVERFTH